MAAMKVELEVVISPTGEVRIKTSGLKGEECIEETKELELALGQVKARQKSSEYYAAKTVKAGVKAGTTTKGK